MKRIVHRSRFWREKFLPGLFALPTLQFYFAPAAVCSAFQSNFIGELQRLVFADALIGKGEHGYGLLIATSIQGGRLQAAGTPSTKIRRRSSAVRRTFSASAYSGEAYH